MNLISTNGRVVLVLLDSIPHYTDRYGFEGVLLGYGLYHIFTESRRVTGEVAPTQDRRGILIRTPAGTFHADRDDIARVFAGEQKTALVTKR